MLFETHPSEIRWHSAIDHKSVSMMPDGQLLRELFRTHATHDHDGFLRAAREVIAHERRLNRRLLAAELESLVSPKPAELRLSRRAEQNFDIPRDKEKGLPLVAISEAKVSWDRLILSPFESSQLQRCALEARQSELLRNAGVRPKQKLLFVGPPGLGKTMSASALATDLGWPLVTVRLDSLVSSFLGETASNLRRIFDFVEAGRFIVLFDECDAVAKERSSGNEHGELQRIVTALLQMLDTFCGDSLLIFATNHEQVLDSALWRRFDLVLRYRYPGLKQRMLILQNSLRSIKSIDRTTKWLASRTAGASGADLYWMATEMIRSCVLDGRDTLSDSDADAALIAHEARRASSGVNVLRKTRPPARLGRREGKPKSKR